MVAVGGGVRVGGLDSLLYQPPGCIASWAVDATRGKFCIIFLLKRDNMIAPILLEQLASS